MGKVKLTKEQGKAIEDNTVQFLGEWFFKDTKPDHYLYKLFKDFTFNELMDAKYDGYEVAPEFKENDWLSNGNGYIRNVIHVTNKGIHLNNGVATHFLGNKTDEYYSLKHATESEVKTEKRRRWWAKHDRDVLGFKENDIVKYDCTSWGGVCRVISNQYSMDAFGKRLIELYNWTSGRIITVRAESLEVICFAEDRKDA